MKTRGPYFLVGFLSLIVAIGLACSSASSPTAQPAATSAPQATQAPSSTEAPSSGGLVTFTDKNNYYQIDVPSDWKHTTSSTDTDYSDTFESPDGNARIENYAYDDGTPWSGKDSGKAALFLLNRYYSKTGQAGDIRVSEEKTQPDGSDKLTWTSKAGGYSGVSFFELRGTTTFLMFTAEYTNSYKDQYTDTLNKVIESYRVP